MYKTSYLLLVLACLVPPGCMTPATAPAAKLPVKVVIVTMFEIGADEGDAAGEFQLWKSRRALTVRYPFPHSHHDIFANEQTGVLGIVTGVGTAKSTAAVMALGLDPRFDLRHAYWLIVGIAGFDPADASLGSAAWAEYLVDADLAHEIDAREKPQDWPFGYFARRTSFPFDPARPAPNGEMFRLNADLTEWAYRLTASLALPDNAELAAARSPYTGFPNALAPPSVLKGDNLAGMTFWHGALLNDWANRWVKYWTDGAGEFVSSAMEDTGSFQALTYLDNLGVVDKNRVMVLRAASNYTMPPPGVSAADNLLRENSGYAGLRASLESAYLVGGKVVDEILSNWELYRDTLPGAPQSTGQ